MPEVYANNASTVVVSGGGTAPASGTVESWTVASPGAFPSLSAGQTFHVADPASATTAAEKIKVTATSGSTWTVTRGDESTTPVVHAGGFTVVQVVTAAALAGLLQSASNLSDLASASTARTNLGLTGAATASLPLSIPDGGTGQASASAALNALGGAAVSR